MFLNVCKRSTLIAQSSTEAELYALAEACRELLWIRSFLGELNLSITCDTIFQDNTTTINMVKQDGMSERSKHIDVKFNFVKRLVKQKLVVCQHIATKQMVADIFTKDRLMKHSEVIQLLCLVDHSARGYSSLTNIYESGYEY